MLTDKMKSKLLDIHEVEKILPEEIRKAEKSLKVKFHSDYRWIIETFGFLDDGKTVISGLGAYEQFENVIWLNNSILKEYRDRLQDGFIAISYQNNMNKILVLDNATGEIYAYDFELRKGNKIFNNIAELLGNMFL